MIQDDVIVVSEKMEFRQPRFSEKPSSLAPHSIYPRLCLPNLLFRVDQSIRASEGGSHALSPTAAVLQTLVR